MAAADRPPFREGARAGVLVGAAPSADITGPLAGLPRSRGATGASTPIGGPWGGRGEAVVEVARPPSPLPPLVLLDPVVAPPRISPRFPVLFLTAASLSLRAFPIASSDLFFHDLVYS